MLDYRTQTAWIPETPGVTSGAVGSFINPATGSTLQKHRPEFAFWWNDRSVRSQALDNWGFATTGWLGLGVNSQVFRIGDQTYRATDWQLGMSGGDRRGRLGLAYRWKANDGEALGRENAFVAGVLSRPHRFVSVGAVGTWSTESRARYGVFDLGLRPLGDDRVTLFGDFTLATTDRWEDGRWGAGVTVRPVRGLHLGVTARDESDTGEVRWSANVGVNVADLGFHWLPSWNADGDLRSNTFLARTNPPARNLVNEVRIFDDRRPRFAVANLENRYLTYQRYQLFDERRVAWLDLERFLDAVAADPQIDGRGAQPPRLHRASLAGLGAARAPGWDLQGARQGGGDPHQPPGHRPPLPGLGGRPHRDGSRGRPGAAGRGGRPVLFRRHAREGRPRLPGDALLQVQVGRRGGLAHGHVRGRARAAPAHGGRDLRGAPRGHLRRAADSPMRPFDEPGRRGRGG